MNLKELLKKCTPTPLLVAVGKEFCFHDTTRVAIVKVRRPSTNNPEGSEETVAEVWPGDNDCDIYDAHRFVHAVNILPELVEAAEHLGCCDFPDEIEHRCPGCVKALETIRKATTINIEQKGK